MGLLKALDVAISVDLGERFVSGCREKTAFCIGEVTLPICLVSPNVGSGSLTTLHNHWGDGI